MAGAESLTITNVRNADVDPPDVCFVSDGEEHGLELTELLPENRLERDAIIRQLTTKVLSSLSFGSATRDWVISITLVDDYASKLRVSPADELVRVLVNFFSDLQPEQRAPTTVPVPPALRRQVRRIDAQRWDLTADPRIGNRDEPLMIFTAQHTNIVPDQDFPAMLRATVGPKALHDIALPTWLLIWSHHYALAALQKDLVPFIEEFVQSMLNTYLRIFYLDLYRAKDLLEFTQD